MTTVAEPRAADREVSPVLAFVGRRLLGAAVSLLVASVLIFIGTSVLPGNAASVVLGRGATPAAVHKLEQQMHLNKPLATQYTNWLGGFVHGDLGDSSIGLAQGQKHAPIWPLISDPVKNSLILALIAALFMIPLSLGLGAIAAVYAGRPADHAISIDVAGGDRAARVRDRLAAGGRVLRLAGRAAAGAIVAARPEPAQRSHQADPAGGDAAAGVARGGHPDGARGHGGGAAGRVRDGGPAERSVRALGAVRYAMRNALAPSVQVLAQNLQWLIGGIIITETVFAYPGLGSLLVTAVGNRDLGVVQSVAMLIAVVYVMLNLVADLIVLLLVPKLREPA